MNVNYDKMGKWELEKAIFLQKTAVDLGMDVSGYGEVAVNPNSGNTYLWLEDYGFCLYMPINCELKKEDVVANWSNPNNGEEETYFLKSGTTLNQLDIWAGKLNKKADKNA
jgi:hypothetical protein